MRREQSTKGRLRFLLVQWLCSRGVVGEYLRIATFEYISGRRMGAE